MAILNSCCCCKSIRKACYACAIYSLVTYLLLITAVLSHYMKEKTDDFSSRNLTKHESVLMPDPVGDAAWIIYIYYIALVLSVIGAFTSILLIIGIWKDKKLLLLPWIIDAPLFILIDVIYVATLGYEKRMNATPTVAMALTVDFFLFILNCYALLCVISQFQEYNAGRGRAIDEYPEAGLSVQFSKNAPPTMNSCETGRRNVPVYESKPLANGGSPRQLRRSFRNPSIKVNRVDKNPKEEIPNLRLDNVPCDANGVKNIIDELNCEDFAASDCVRSSANSTTSSTTGNLVRKEGTKKKASQFHKVNETDSSNTNQAADVSETSATTECESSSGREWTPDKILEEFPLIILPDVDCKDTI